METIEDKRYRIRRECIISSQADRPDDVVFQNIELASSEMSVATWSYSPFNLSCSSCPISPFVGLVNTRTQHVGLFVAPALARSWKWSVTNKSIYLFCTYKPWIIDINSWKQQVFMWYIHDHNKNLSKSKWAMIYFGISYIICFENKYHSRKRLTSFDGT